MSYNDNPKYKLKSKVLSRYIPGQSKVIAEQGIRQPIQEQPDTANWYKGIEIKPKFEISKSESYSRGVDKDIPLKETATETKPYVSDARTVVENGQMKQVPVFTSTPQRKLSLEDYSNEYDSRGNIIIPEKRIDKSIANKVNTAVYNSLNATGIDPTSGMGTVLTSVMNPIFTGLEQMQRGNKEKKFGREITDNILGLATIGIGSIPAMVGVNSLTPAITEFSGNVAENLGMSKETGEKIGHLISFAPFGSKVILAGLTSTTAGDFVAKLLEDKDISETDKERIIETAHHIGFFGGLGTIGLTKNVYRNLKTRADINSLSPEKLTPQRLQNAILEEIQKENQRQVIQTLEKDRQTAQMQFEKAQTPEERLKALNTIEKIDVKKKEYEEKPVETITVEQKPESTKEEVLKEKPEEVKPEEVKPETKPILITEDKSEIKLKQPEIISKEETKTLENKEDTKPETTTSQKYRIGRSPMTYSLVERLPFNAKTDLPDEKYVKIKNDKTGEVFVSLESDLKLVKQSEPVDANQHKIDLIDKKIKAIEKKSKGNVIAEDEARIRINKLKTKREQLSEKIETKPFEDKQETNIAKVNDKVEKPEIKKESVPETKTELKADNTDTNDIKNKINKYRENLKEIEDLKQKMYKSHIDEWDSYERKIKLLKNKNIDLTTEENEAYLRTLLPEVKIPESKDIPLNEQKKKVLEQIEQINNLIDETIPDAKTNKNLRDAFLSTLEIKDPFRKELQKRGFKIKEAVANKDMSNASKTLQIEIDFGNNGKYKYSLNNIDSLKSKIISNLKDSKEVIIPKHKNPIVPKTEVKERYIEKELSDDVENYKEAVRTGNEKLAKILKDNIDKYEEAKQILKDALKKDSGISFGGLSKLSDLSDPKILKAVYTIGKYHYENGAKALKDFSRVVIKEVGDWIKPHLKILYGKLKGESDLIARHNLYSDRLKFADEIGGIANPSLAITKRGLPFEKFGDITLITDKKMINPYYKNAKVFGADVYSPRYPIINAEYDYNKLRELNKQVYQSNIKYKENPNISESSILDNTIFKEYNKEGLYRNLEFQIYYLDQIAKNKDINIDYNDYSKIREAIKGDETNYRKYIDKVFADITKDKKIFKGYTYNGNRRYKPLTLENLSKELKSNLRGGENFNYGSGTLRSHLTPEYKKINDIVKAKEKLVSPDKFNDIKNKIDDELYDVINTYDYGDKNSYTRADVFIDIIADAIRSKKNIVSELNEFGFKNGDNQKLYGFLTKLKTLPTEYFESIITRPVKLNEFKTAVVPKDISEEVLDILNKNGISDIRKYKDSAERQSIIDNMNEYSFGEEISYDKYLKAKTSLQKKLSRANMTFGLDTLPELYTIGKYHLTKGAVKFADWTKRMLKELGDKVKPHLRTLWNELTKDRTRLKNATQQGISPQIFTEPFKRWFGDWKNNPKDASKVVDKEGKPLVVYHGTNKNFRKFDLKKSTQGIVWFTDDLEAIKTGDVGATGKGKIMELYADIKNPAGWKEYEKYTLGQLKDMGYDGAILPDGNKMYGFVFKPNQLKSANKNAGTFDKESDIITQGFSILPESVAHLFRSRGKLPEQLHKQIETLKAKQRANNVETQQHIRDFRKAVLKEYGRKSMQDRKFAETLNDYLTGNKKIQIKPQTKLALDNIRKNIDKYSQDLLNTPLLSKELTKIVGDNMGEYLTRFYERDYNKKWENFIYNTKEGQKIYSEAEQYIKKQWDDAGKSYTSDELAGELQRLMQPVRDEFSPNFSQGKETTIDRSTLKHREDIPEEIRNLMGEFKDPLANYSRSVFKMGNMISKAGLLANMRKEGLGKYLYDKPVKNAEGDFTYKIADKDNPAYKPLTEGKDIYTTKDIAESLEQAFNEKETNPLVKLYQQSMGLVRYGKTALSPVTTARNIISNPVMLLANGYTNFHQTHKGIKLSDAEKKRLTELNIIGSSANLGELRDVTTDIFRQQSDTATMRKNAFKTAKDIFDKPGQFYGAIDDVFKVQAFKKEMQRYKNSFKDELRTGKLKLQDLEKQVAEIVTDVLPTYSKVPPIIKKYIRRLPIGNFVSFPAEIIRTMYNIPTIAMKEMKNPKTRSIGVERMGAFIGTLTAVSSLPLISRMLSGVSTEEEHALRGYLPDWQKNSQFFHLGKDEKGNYNLIDLSYTDPYNYIKKPVLSMLWGNDPVNSMAEGIKEFLSPFVTEEILAKTILDISRNKDTDRNKEIYNEEDIPSQQAMDMLEYALSKVSPGFVTQAQRIKKATDEEKTVNKRYDVKNELLGLTGIRKTKINPEDVMTFSAIDLKKELNRIKTLETKAQYQYKDNKEKLAERLEQINGLLNTKYEDFKQTIEDAKTLGLKDYEIRIAFEQAGLSKDQIKALTEDKIKYYSDKSELLNLNEDLQEAGLPKYELRDSKKYKESTEGKIDTTRFREWLYGKRMEVDTSKSVHPEIKKRKLDKIDEIVKEFGITLQKNDKLKSNTKYKLKSLKK